MGISQFLANIPYACSVSPYNQMLKSYVVVINTWLSPYCYNNVIYDFNSPYLNPTTSVAIIGLSIIVFIAVMEVSLNATIGIFVGFSRISATGLTLAYGAFIRLLLTVLIVIILPLGYGGGTGGGSPNCLTECRIHKQYHFRIPPCHHAAVYLGTLSANVMRPYDDRSVEYKKYGTQDLVTYVVKSNYDNRHFVLRNLVAAMIAGLFYFLLIRFFLRRATVSAIINRGAWSA